MTYSYDPASISDGGMNQMRFELQDTEVSGGAQTCAMCDEEYTSILSKGGSWRSAKIRCLKAVCAKLAWEVDFSIDGLSMSLSKRLQYWKDKLKDLESVEIVPEVDSSVLSDSGDGDHYFYFGMLRNPNASE